MKALNLQYGNSKNATAIRLSFSCSILKQKKFLSAFNWFLPIELSLAYEKTHQIQVSQNHGKVDNWECFQSGLWNQKFEALKQREQ